MEEEIKKLKTRLDKVEKTRITQDRIVPDAIKSRAMGEGIRFIRSGATADKPTAGEEPPASAAVFYDTTTNKLWVWNSASSAWKSTTLS